MEENPATSSPVGLDADALFAEYASVARSRESSMSSRWPDLYESAASFASEASRTAAVYAVTTAVPAVTTETGASIPQGFERIHDHALSGSPAVYNFLIDVCWPWSLKYVIYPGAALFLLFNGLATLAGMYPDAGRDAVDWLGNLLEGAKGWFSRRMPNVYEDCRLVVNRIRYNSYWPVLQQWYNKVYNWFATWIWRFGLFCALVAFVNMATRTSRESTRIYNEYHDPGGVAFSRREMEKVTRSLASLADWSASQASSATAFPEPTQTAGTQSSTRTWDWVSDIAYGVATPVVTSTVSAETNTDSWFWQHVWKRAAPVVSGETAESATVTSEITWPTEVQTIQMPYIDWATLTADEGYEPTDPSWKSSTRVQQRTKRPEMEDNELVGKIDEQPKKIGETERVEEERTKEKANGAEESRVLCEEATVGKEEHERKESMNREDRLEEEEMKREELKKQENDVQAALEEESRSYLEEKRQKEEEEERNWTGFASWPSTVNEPALPSDAFRAPVQPLTSPLKVATTVLPHTDTSDIPSTPCTTIRPSSTSESWLGRNVWKFGTRKPLKTSSSREVEEKSELVFTAILTPSWPSDAAVKTVSLTSKTLTNARDISSAPSRATPLASSSDSLPGRTIWSEGEEESLEIEYVTEPDIEVPSAFPERAPAASSESSDVEGILTLSAILDTSATPVSTHSAAKSTLPTSSTSNSWFGRNLWKRIADQLASTPGKYKHILTTTVSLFETTTLHGTTTSTKTITVEPSEETTAVMQPGDDSTPKESISRAQTIPSTTTTTLFEIETVHTTRTSTITTTVEIGGEGCESELKALPSKMPSTKNDAGEVETPLKTTTSTLTEITTIYPTVTRTIRTTIDAGREIVGIKSAFMTLVDAFIPMGSAWPQTRKDKQKGEDVHLHGRDLEEGEVAYCHECRQRHCCRVV